jgi:hypothetical protein
MKRTEAIIMMELRAAHSLLARGGSSVSRKSTPEETAERCVSLREWIEDLTVELGRSLSEAEVFLSLYTH